MSKLSLDALRMRAESITSEKLMASVSGGTENACHDTPAPPKNVIDLLDDQQGSPRPPLTPVGEALIRWIFG